MKFIKGGPKLEVQVLFWPQPPLAPPLGGGGYRSLCRGVGQSRTSPQGLAPH